MITLKLWRMLLADTGSHHAYKAVALVILTPAIVLIDIADAIDRRIHA